MPMLAELVELVIGVDTHADTHTAALVAVDTRALLATITVATDADGYTQLLELAERHGGLRAWAIEGAGGYGAGLAATSPTPGRWSWSWTARFDRPVAAGPSPM
jgi:transposase